MFLEFPACSGKRKESRSSWKIQAQEGRLFAFVANDRLQVSAVVAFYIP
jgi:hypothetical protein